MRRISAIIQGLGNIGNRFVGVLQDKGDLLRDHYGLDVRIVGAADTGGAAHNPDGLDLGQLKALGRQQSVATLPNTNGTISDASTTTAVLLQQVQADVFFEATPVNLTDGEPGMSAIRAALVQGLHVITTNKGPLALAYGELAALAQASGVQLRHCGAVFGGLPAISIAERDLAATTMLKLEAQANLANSFILHQMADGVPYADAVQAAKDRGSADADETLDVDGWDAVIKLVILANSVLGLAAKIEDVERVSMRDIDPQQIHRARERGAVLKYLASAELNADGGYMLRAAPVALPLTHPLAPLGPHQMGVAYTTDLFGTITAAILEESPLPSASALLRDLLIIFAKGLY